MAGLVVALLAGCTPPPSCDAASGCADATASQSPATGGSPSPSRTGSPTPVPGGSTSATTGPAPDPPVAGPGAAPAPAPGYPVHTNIVATTFWVGEVFDPNASDGSQVFSTYDSKWLQSYGGCDGITLGGACQTERRGAANNYLPTQFTPQQNPFYLDLPFDDVNNAAAFARRDQVVPWANQQPYASHHGDPRFSYMKNRWVGVTLNGRTCYAQIQDAGPAQYDDAAYVFGTTDSRPLNTRFGGAGMDVSPAVVGCLGFSDLNGEQGGITWSFVDDSAVPPGPWTRIVTTSGVQ